MYTHTNFNRPMEITHADRLSDLEDSFENADQPVYTDALSHKEEELFNYLLAKRYVSEEDIQTSCEEFSKHFRARTFTFILGYRGPSSILSEIPFELIEYIAKINLKIIANKAISIKERFTTIFIRMTHETFTPVHYSGDGEPPDPKKLAFFPLLSLDLEKNWKNEKHHTNFPKSDVQYHRAIQHYCETIKSHQKLELKFPEITIPSIANLEEKLKFELIENFVEEVSSEEPKGETLSSLCNIQ